MHYWWWVGKLKRKKTTDQYAEEKKWIFSSDLKEESEDERIWLFDFWKLLNFLTRVYMSCPSKNSRAYVIIQPAAGHKRIDVKTMTRTLGPVLSARPTSKRSGNTVHMPWRQPLLCRVDIKINAVAISASDPVGPSGKALVRLVSRGTSIRIRFGSSFSLEIVVSGHCLVTLSLTMTETLKWPSSLHAHLNAGVILVVTV